LDWEVRGFWEFQREALFDICILNADAPSYSTTALQSLFDKARERKYMIYCDSVEARRASFTPIIASCEGIFDHQAMVYIKRLSTLLASKWENPTLYKYSTWMAQSKNASLYTILRSVSLCIRGSRTKWRGAGIEHGAQISLYSV